MACIGVLVDSGVVQLLLFGVVHTASFVFLVVLKPFANWWGNKRCILRALAIPVSVEQESVAQF